MRVLDPNLLERVMALMVKYEIDEVGAEEFTIKRSRRGVSAIQHQTIAAPPPPELPMEPWNEVSDEQLDSFAATGKT